MKNEPFVSVITIFLNAEKFLEEAIGSALAQTFTNWELLLVDDGSTDKSTAIALRYAGQYPRNVRYLEHENHENRGMSAARNLGIKNARGDYIAFLDADDFWMPHKLEQQVGLLEAMPEVGMVYGRSLYWKSWTGHSEDVGLDYVPDFGYEPGSVMRPPMLLKLSYPLGKIHPPCPSDLLLRREVVEEVGGFEESFRGDNMLYEDQAFLAKVYLETPVLIAGECWDKYRLHPESCDALVTKSGRYHEVRSFFLKWLEAYLSRKGVRETEIWDALRCAIFPYRHPVVHRLQDFIRSVLSEMRWASTALGISLAGLGSFIFRRGTGSLEACPNPVRLSLGEEFGETTLTWTSMMTKNVEVRIGAPDGKLFSRSGPSGSMVTGKWVSDGSVFYLQDVSDGKSLTRKNTLAAIRVRTLCD